MAGSCVRFHLGKSLTHSLGDATGPFPKAENRRRITPRVDLDDLCRHRDKDSTPGQTTNHTRQRGGQRCVSNSSDG